VSGSVAWTANTSGIRAARLAVNGTAVDGSQAQVPAAATSPSICVHVAGQLVYLAVGDYVEIQGFQSSGGGLLTDVGGANSSRLTVMWASN
jgi:hypothetical protein